MSPTVIAVIHRLAGPTYDRPGKPKDYASAILKVSGMTLTVAGGSFIDV